jgi:homocysteine S-methyltransferase
MARTPSGAPLLQRLADGPVLADGAMGTMLYARGAPIDACFDVLNLNAPRTVQAIHQEYVAAGADLIETNTFGANRFKLAVHGLEGRVREINRAGARLARDVRETMGRDVLVLGSIGPLGKYLAPIGVVSEADGLAAFREQAEALLEGGVDACVVETFSDLRELRLAVSAIRAASSDVPIIAQMAFSEERLTFMGQRPADVARELLALPVQVIGANCGVGPSALYDVLLLLHQAAPQAWLSIMPNAGLPSRLGERLIYLSSPPYMADYAGRMLDSGARIVGGCCGTTPAHTRAMRETLDRHAGGAGRPRRSVLVPSPVAPAGEETPALAVAPEPSRLLARLRAGEFVVTVELDPPRGHNIEKLVQGAKLLAERGVEVVDINDGSLGRLRMAVLPTAMLVRESTGLDISMHFTCRDRNLMGIQADLLGAHALGIRNILAMTGDPPRAGDYVNATAVFDVDAIGLVRIVSGMNRGVDATGNSIGEPTAFGIGVALDPGAADPGREIERLHAKIAAGAMWVQTQPVYDLDRLDAFLARAGRLPVPVVVGILPLHSFRHAEFLHNEVPGIGIPEAVRARLRAAGDHALRVGVETAQATLQEVRRRYAGAYLMPSFGRFEVVAEVLEALR